MAKRIRLFGPSQIPLVAATVFTNVTGKAARLESFTITQPSGGLAKTVRLTIGTDGLTTRVFEAPIPAGAGFYQFNPGFVLTGTDIMQLSSTADNNIAIAGGFGTEEAV